METASTTLKRRKMVSAATSAFRTPREAVGGGVAKANGRWTSERWVSELIALALVLFLIGAAVIYGLAVVSRRAPAPSSLAATSSIPSDHEAGASAVEPT